MMIFTLKVIYFKEETGEMELEKKKINISRKDLLPRNYSINSSSSSFAIPSWSSDDRKKKAAAASDSAR